MATPADTMNPDNEAAPLLGAKKAPASRSQKLTVMIATTALILAIDFGFYLTTAPQTKVFENIICRNYLNAQGQPAGTILTDGVCKSEPVQVELALVNGWKETSDIVPGILLSVPYGILADRWGRKPVLLLGILGTLLGESWVRVVCFYPTILPLRLVWLSGLWKIIGGGDNALSSIALVMVADVFPEEEIATALFRLGSAVFLSEILATPVSAYLMASDPWIPFVLGLGIAILGSGAALLMPETLTKAKSKVFLTTEASEEEAQLYSDENDSLGQHIKVNMRKLRDSTKFIFGNTAVAICLFSLFIAAISKQSTSLLLQYTSKRFDWSIANSSLLISLRGIFALANFLLLMPAVSSILTKYFHLPSSLKDLRIAQGSSFISALGLFIIGTASSRAILITGIVFVALGAPFAVSCRSFVTSLIRPDQMGTLYSSASAVTSIGMMIAGPLLAYAFRLGLHLGPAWLGLPFTLAGAIYLLGSISLVLLRVPDRVHRE
ncbi:MFS general substrate transporter [Penicillium verhagenii]|uniref:MFS general substrate transporter n=1 Tax=Penicillium verhagenii TaxID=1562060 RepID=UPI002545520A|nr:MFS general substrate transporter [Penicillium verhagenii]KAJ5915558.1 MFS general substrate transporter [Penicillium verhagenii]